jgi:hypothetical protein
MLVLLGLCCHPYVVEVADAGGFGGLVGDDLGGGLLRGPWEWNRTPGEIATTTVHSGHYAVQLPTGSGLGQTVTGLETGRTYRISGWIKDDATAKTVRLWLGVKEYGGSDQLAYPAHTRTVRCGARGDKPGRRRRIPG